MSPIETVLPTDRSSTELTPPSNADVARRVVHSFDEAIADMSDTNMGALHAATIALAASLRGTAITPERAVIALKALLRGHGPAGWAPSLAAQRHALTRGPESLVYEKLFGWWVAAYFADRAARDA